MSDEANFSRQSIYPTPSQLPGLQLELPELLGSQSWCHLSPKQLLPDDKIRSKALHQLGIAFSELAPDQSVSQHQSLSIARKRGAAVARIEDGKIGPFADISVPLFKGEKSANFPLLSDNLRRSTDVRAAVSHLVSLIPIEMVRGSYELSLILTETTIPKGQMSCPVTSIGWHSDLSLATYIIFLDRFNLTPDSAKNGVKNGKGEHFMLMTEPGEAILLSEHPRGDFANTVPSVEHVITEMRRQVENEDAWRRTALLHIKKPSLLTYGLLPEV